MPRIAVQFFGHLRTFEKCLPSIKRHLLNRYECDIFMHTWDTYNHNSKTWHNNFKNVNKKVNQEQIIQKLGILPEQIKIEHQKLYTDDKIIVHGYEFALQGLMSVYHSIKTVNKLREDYQKKHKIKYDMVVCIRPDVVLLEDLKIEKYINDKFNQDGTNIYLAGHTPDRDMYGLNYVETVDLLFFGGAKAISKLCDKLKVPAKKGDNIDYHAEGFLIDNILSHNLRPVYLGSYQYIKSFKIKRFAQIKLNRSNIISFHLRKKGIFIHLLRILPPITNIDINLFNWFSFVFSIGKFD